MPTISCFYNGQIHPASQTDMDSGRGNIPSGYDRTEENYAWEAVPGFIEETVSSVYIGIDTSAIPVNSEILNVTLNFDISASPYDVSVSLTNMSLELISSSVYVSSDVLTSQTFSNLTYTDIETLWVRVRSVSDNPFDTTVRVYRLWVDVEYAGGGQIIEATSPTELTPYSFNESLSIYHADLNYLYDAEVSSQGAANIASLLGKGYNFDYTSSSVTPFHLATPSLSSSDIINGEQSVNTFIVYDFKFPAFPENIVITDCYLDIRFKYLDDMPNYIIDNHYSIQLGIVDDDGEFVHSVESKDAYESGVEKTYRTNNQDIENLTIDKLTTYKLGMLYKTHHGNKYGGLVGVHILGATFTIEFQIPGSTIREFKVKIGGTWKNALELYKKIDGIWVLQTDLSTIFDTDQNYK